MNVKILIDSASDITLAESKKLGVELISLIVSFGEEDYLDGVNLLPSDFYEKLLNCKVMPKTSQITPFRFEEKLEEMTQDGSSVVVITLSSKLSGTYKAALTASKKFKDVYVVDSLSATIGEKMLCMYALELIKEGLSAKDIYEKLNKKKEKIKIYALVDTLEFLKRGGRISSTVALAGSVLQMKPVLTIFDGEVKMVGKAIGIKRGNNTILELIDKTNGIDYNHYHGYIFSGDNKENLAKFKKDFNQVIVNDLEIPECEIGSTIGTHVGPGVCGFAYFEK